VNQNRLEGKSKQISGQPEEQRGGLTKDRQDQIADRTQDRFRIYREEALRKLKAFLHRNRDWDTSSR
jgi:hypothetical protein